MARKFLYFVAIVAILIIAGGFALNIWSKEATQLAFVPSADFEEQDALADNAYADPEMWYSRPGIGTQDPARWQPATAGEGRTLPAPADASPPDFAVFFVHPTSFLDRSAWNAPLGEKSAEDRARLFLRGLASPFNQASEIWAPKYRQATVGAFLTDAPEAERAINAAYADIEQAFAFFVSSLDDDTPIVLASHSQGSVHLLRLMKESIGDSDLAARIAVAYPIGWPISVQNDLPALPFPACATPAQGNCIVSWSSFAEPADPSDIFDLYRPSIGLTGRPRGNSPVLCTNPLTGMIGGDAPMDENLGTLVPNADMSGGELLPGAVPASCSESGLLIIGDPPEMGPAVLPGNNYHVYDIPLYWRNLQQDVGRRVTAFAGAGE